jgi:hypothetical protein
MFGMQPQIDRRRQEAPRPATLFERCMLAIVVCVTCLTAITVAMSRALWHGLICIAALALAGLSYTALAWGTPRGARRVALVGALIVGLCLGAWALLPSG